MKSSRSEYPLKRLEPRTLDKVKSDKVLFIKLGGRGEWESNCILKSNTLKLGFNEADFQSCLNGEWDKIKNDYLKSGKNRGVASGYTNQIKYFFQEPKDTIWRSLTKQCQ